MKKIILLALASITIAGCYKEDLASDYCGHATQNGTLCKRKVSGGGYCWQHK